MLPPYESAEVAEAVQRRLARNGTEPARPTVTADDVLRLWCIEALLPDGHEVAMRYPFAAPEGIHTPAELAEWFAQDVA